MVASSFVLLFETLFYEIKIVIFSCSRQARGQVVRGPQGGQGGIG
jgi:hypothetical protein